MDSEFELTEKLLKTFHLSVPERKLLPNGKIKLSIIKKIIIEKLNDSGWFPENWRPDNPFVGGLLEYNQEKRVKLYHKEEVSVSNPQLIKITEYSSFDQAVVEFLKITYGLQIDGIPIDSKS